MNHGHANIHKAQACVLQANSSKSRKYIKVLKIMNLFEATKCSKLECQSLKIPIQKSLEPEATNLLQLLTARCVMPPCDHILAVTLVFNERSTTLHAQKKN